MEEKPNWVDYLIYIFVYWCFILLLSLGLFYSWDWKLPSSPIQLGGVALGFIAGFVFIVLRIYTWDIYLWQRKETKYDAILYAPIFYRILPFVGVIGLSLSDLVDRFFGSEIGWAIATAGLLSPIVLFFWHFIEIILYIAFHHLSKSEEK